MCIANFPFWIFLGDIHGETRNIHKIKDIQNAQAIVITGDIGKNGTVHDTQKVLQEFAAFQKNQTKIYAQIGNMDSLQVDTYLSDNNMNLHRNLIKFSTAALFGMGGSLPTPFMTKSEFSEEFYRENLKQFLPLPKELLTIFISHNPPYGTACDRLKNGKHVESMWEAGLFWNLYKIISRIFVFAGIFMKAVQRISSEKQRFIILGILRQAIMENSYFLMSLK